MSSNALSAGRHLLGVADLERLEYRADVLTCRLASSLTGRSSRGPVGRFDDGNSEWHLLV
jgi:hypothetical protein